MNRRNFLKSLLAIPAIPFLKPEMLPSVEDVTEIRELNTVGNGTVYTGGSFFNYPPYPDELAIWNGESWSALEFGTDGSLYIEGDFLLETPEQIRQRRFEGLDNYITTGK